MITCSIYLRKKQAIVPTPAITEAGFFIEMEPVAVADAADTAAVVHAIVSALERGNPRIKTPARDAFPPPVVLPYAGVKSWKTFEKGAQTWGIDVEAKHIVIRPQRTHAEGGWVDDEDRLEYFAPDTPFEKIAQRVAQLVQLAMK
jgi:hypothetical protein